MATSASAKPTFAHDSNEAIAHALAEDDWAYISDEMRQRVTAWLAHQCEEALKEPAIEVDIDEFFEGVKRRGRERLRAATQP